MAAGFETAVMKTKFWNLWLTESCLGQIILEGQQEVSQKHQNSFFMSSQRDKCWTIKGILLLVPAVVQYEQVLIFDALVVSCNYEPIISRFVIKKSLESGTENQILQGPRVWINKAIQQSWSGGFVGGTCHLPSHLPSRPLPHLLYLTSSSCCPWQSSGSCYCNQLHQQQQLVANAQWKPDSFSCLWISFSQSDFENHLE